VAGFAGVRSTTRAGRSASSPTSEAIAGATLPLRDEGMGTIVEVDDLVRHDAGPSGERRCRPIFRNRWQQGRTAGSSAG
jgi:hypothetical protein